MTTWLPISTAPRDDGLVLLHAGGWTTMGWFDDHDNAWIDDRIPDYQDQRIEPTHWLPLPDPPKE